MLHWYILRAMAYRRLSLPVIKLTKRPAVGEKSLHFVAGTLPHELACPSSYTSEDEASGERGNTRESLSENEAPMDSLGLWDIFVLDALKSPTEP